MKVCFVGSDAHPPWSHASAILAKRLIECLSREGVECSLATSLGEEAWDKELADARKLFARTSGSQSLDAVRLSVASRAGSPDVFHLIGTNALLFSPLSKIFRHNTKILRHIFTPYDAKDRAVGPVRTVANRLFIDSYAFTTPRIGKWEEEVGNRTRRFVLRPPIDTAFYRPNSEGSSREGLSEGPHVVYMGPLMPTRFPGDIVLGAIKRLTEEGREMRLTVLTSASRTSDQECERLLARIRDFSLSENVKVRRADLPERERVDWYNAADVVVFPYVGPEPEKLADPPFGILEAMSCGRVVLSSNVLSVSDIVEDGVNGFLMPNTTLESMWDGLRRALEATGTRSIQKRARESIVNTFDYPVVAKKAVAAYSTLLA